MKVILKEDVDSLGKIGELVDVKKGYARNYLLPQNKGVEATTKNVKVLEHEKRLIDDKIRKEKKAATDLATRISELSITIPVQVGEEDKMFGSVTNMDIAEAMEKEGIVIDKRKIVLEHPLKELGVFPVSIKLNAETTTEVKVWLVKA